MTTVLIDADSLVYAAAAVADTRTYVVRGSDGVAHGPYQTKKEALTILADDPTAGIYTRLETGSFDEALIRLRASVARVKLACTQRCGAITPLVFVSGSANFRDRLPAAFPYKGNRINVEKPQHLGRLRTALIDSGAIAIHGWEPDDEITIRMTEDPTAICVSIDKDLKQVAGVHMVPDQGFTTISPRSALLRLYSQIIAGDATDGVPGCYGISAEGATKLLFPHVRAEDSLEQTALKFWKVAVDCYASMVQRRGAKWQGHQDPAKAACETARFVYLLRKRPKDIADVKLWEAPR